METVLTGETPSAKNERIVKQQQIEIEEEIEKEKEADEFRNRRASWIGYHIDDLSLKWGAPWGVHKRQDGGAQYTWKRTQYSGWDVWSGGWTQSSLCVDTFVTDSVGIIKDWNTSGCYE